MSFLNSPSRCFLPNSSESDCLSCMVLLRLEHPSRCLFCIAVAMLLSWSVLMLISLMSSIRTWPTAAANASAARWLRSCLSNRKPRNKSNAHALAQVVQQQSFIFSRWWSAVPAVQCSLTRAGGQCHSHRRSDACRAAQARVQEDGSTSGTYEHQKGPRPKKKARDLDPFSDWCLVDHALAPPLEPHALRPFAACRRTAAAKRRVSGQKVPNGAAQAELACAVDKTKRTRRRQASTSKTGDVPIRSSSNPLSPPPQAPTRRGESESDMGKPADSLNPFSRCALSVQIETRAVVMFLCPPPTQTNQCPPTTNSMLCDETTKHSMRNLGNNDIEEFT